MNILETGSRPGKCTKCGHEVLESSGSTRSAWKDAGVHGGTGIELLLWAQVFLHGIMSAKLVGVLQNVTGHNRTIMVYGSYICHK